MSAHVHDADTAYDGFCAACLPTLQAGEIRAMALHRYHHDPLTHAQVTLAVQLAQPEIDRRYLDRHPAAREVAKAAAMLAVLLTDITVLEQLATQNDPDMQLMKLPMTISTFGPVDQ